MLQSLCESEAVFLKHKHFKQIDARQLALETDITKADLAEQALLGSPTGSTSQADSAQPQLVPMRPLSGLQQAPGIKAPRAANQVTEPALQSPPGFPGPCASDRHIVTDLHLESATSADICSSTAASDPEASCFAEQALLGSPTSRGMLADPAQLAEGQVFCICLQCMHCMLAVSCDIVTG